MKTNKHGDVGSKLYNTWRGMLNRSRHGVGCYADLSVYDGWLSYLIFKDWAMKNGYVDGLTIDRINGSRGYYPDNCRFVTQKINNLNRITTLNVIYKLEKIPLVLLLERKNIIQHYTTIWRRISRGWSVDSAVDTPIRLGNYKRKVEHYSKEIE